MGYLFLPVEATQVIKRQRFMILSQDGNYIVDMFDLISHKYIDIYRSKLKNQSYYLTAIP